MKKQRQTQQLQEQEFERNLEYEEWLRENIRPLTPFEISQLENKHSGAFIIKKPSLFPYPINSLHYQPLKGA